MDGCFACIGLIGLLWVYRVILNSSLLRLPRCGFWLAVACLHPIACIGLVAPHRLGAACLIGIRLALLSILSSFGDHFAYAIYAGLVSVYGMRVPVRLLLNLTHFMNLNTIGVGMVGCMGLIRTYVLTSH